MAPDTFAHSLWASLSAPAEPRRALAGDIECDVLVVGAGFLGLSTALHLAEGGVRVVLVEADEAGFGASGRNTGFVVPSLKTAIGPADVGLRLGTETGERLVGLVGASGAAVFDLIDRLGLACDAEQTGWLQPAHSVAVARILEKRQAEWRQRGRPVEILSAAETTRRVGTDGYHAALFDPTGGQINPLAYARGLARACEERGVSLFQGTRVSELERVGGRWRARTMAGSVLADRVILTTNALVGALRPDVFSAIVPVRVHQIATQPLTAELRSAILPGRSPSSDTRRHSLAVRWSPDGRLMTGGLVLPGSGALKRAARFFTARLERFFPRAAPLRADHVWSGIIAVTPDSLPRFLALAPGLDAAIGCNGRGIALTTSLGRDIAALVTGRMGPADFPLPHEAPRAVFGRRLAGYAPALWLPWSALRDRLEAGR